MYRLVFLNSRLARKNVRLLLLMMAQTFHHSTYWQKLRTRWYILGNPIKDLVKPETLVLQWQRDNIFSFIDADDFLISGNYDKCLDFIRFKDADIVLFDFATKDTSNIQLANNEVVSGTEYMHNNNLRASACGYIFRKNILVNLRFTKGILHEDEEFTPQLFICADKVYNTKVQAYFL